MKVPFSDAEFRKDILFVSVVTVGIMILVAIIVAACTGEESSVSPVVVKELPTVVFQAHEVVATEIPAYSRSDWKHWVDADKDCQDARQEVLVRDTRSDLGFKTDRKCKVISGLWNGLYGGTPFTDPSNLDVDHVVPLKNAHMSGGWMWDAETKEAYANDLSPGHLLAVSASLNRQKGAKGPEGWMPPRVEFWCSYARLWEIVKDRWDLTMTVKEHWALEEMKATCD